MSWDNFYKLSTLSISTADVDYSSVNIYSNGNNQVKLLIKLIAVDSSGTELDLSDNDIINNLYLCDFQTGERLSSEWKVSTSAGDYVGIISGQTRNTSSTTESRTKNNYLYLSCSKDNLQKDVAVGIRFPVVVDSDTKYLDFNTTSDGTSTLNGPGGMQGGVFKSPSNITVNTIIPVDYSLPINVSVTGRVTSNDSYTVDVSNIKQERNQWLSDKHDGTISYHSKMQIESSLANHYFVKKVIDEVNSGIASLSGMKRNNGKKIAQTFKIPAGRDATSGELTTLYAMFIDVAEFGLRGGTGKITMMQDVAMHIDPHVIFEAQNSLKGYSATIGKKYISVSSLRFGYTFDKLRIPRASDSESSWALGTKDIHVTVTDNFGNTGDVIIAMTSQNGMPYIEVNRA